MDKEQEGEERQPSDLRPVQVDLGRKRRSAQREQKSATKKIQGASIWATAIIRMPVHHSWPKHEPQPTPCALQGKN